MIYPEPEMFQVLCQKPYLEIGVNFVKFCLTEHLLVIFGTGMEPETFQVLCRIENKFIMNF